MCQNYVKKTCQMQIPARTLSEKILKCVENVSDFKKISENGQQKTVGNLSEVELLTYF